MSNVIIPGQRIKPRLSQGYLDAMSADQKIQARSIIGRLYRADDCEGRDTRADGIYRTLPLSVRDGTIWWGNQTRLGTGSQSVGKQVCAAVMAGFFNGDGQPDPRTPDDLPDERPVRDEIIVEVTPDDKPAPEPKPKPEPKVGEGARPGESAREYLFRRQGEIREFLTGSERKGDFIGGRFNQGGDRMLNVGIPPDAVLHAYAIDWPDNARRAAGIPTYDPCTFGERIPGEHRALAYILALVKARQPVLLVGPAGTGKTYLTERVAEIVNLPYGDIALSEGASISWLFGRNMPQGYIGADLVETFANSGVFCIDELDAADANLAIGLNKPLANDRFTNPVTGKELVKSAIGSRLPQRIRGDRVQTQRLPAATA